MMGSRLSIFILSSICLGIGGCSRSKGRKPAAVGPVADSKSQNVVDRAENPAAPGESGCELDTSPVFVENASHFRFEVPAYVAKAHERFKELRKGAGYGGGEVWTYGLDLPTCDPEHPSVHIGFVLTNRVDMGRPKMKHGPDDRIAYELDQGRCFGSMLMYVPGQGVTLPSGTGDYQNVDRSVNADRTQCVVQSLLDRAEDGTVFREIVGLQLRYYKDCESCPPRVAGDTLQIAVPQSDWPWLKPMVMRMIETYTIDYVTLDKIRIDAAGERGATVHSPPGSAKLPPRVPLFKGPI